MEIIYRVYEIIDTTETDWRGNSIKDKIMLDQTICCCNSREHFKEIMRDMYQPKKFILLIQENSMMVIYTLILLVKIVIILNNTLY